MESGNEGRVCALCNTNDALRIRTNRRKTTHFSECDGWLSAGNRSQRADCD